jgi:hypothetical protein
MKRSYKKICRSAIISSGRQLNSSVPLCGAMNFLLDLTIRFTPAVAPYPACLASGTVTCPPFVANRSGGRITADDYYQQMMISRMERQELEEQ